MKTSNLQAVNAINASNELNAKGFEQVECYENESRCISRWINRSTCETYVMDMRKAKEAAMFAHINPHFNAALYYFEIINNGCKKFKEEVIALL